MTVSCALLWQLVQGLGNHLQEDFLRNATYQGVQIIRCLAGIQLVPICWLVRTNTIENSGNAALKLNFLVSVHKIDKRDKIIII